MRRLFSRPAWLGLARGLLDALGREHPGENVIVWPASAAGMLAAVDLGAGPAAHGDILKVLGIAPGPAGEGDLAALREAAARTASSEDPSTATRVVFDKALHSSPEALDRLRAAGIESEITDLHAPSAVADINAWAARATRGKIPGIIDRIALDEEMIALNALYFSNRWAHQFEPSETLPGDFTTASGQHIRAPFMHGGSVPLAIRRDERFVAVDLPFQGDRFALVALTMAAGASRPSDFADHLAWLGGLDFVMESAVAVDLPRLDLHTSQPILSALESVGLDGRSAFSRFSRQSLFLSEARQAVDIVLDEKGAKVAAVTGAEARVVSKFNPARNLEIVFDKPFAYALRDTWTGLILAAGFVSVVDGRLLAAGQIPVPAGSPLMDDAANWCTRAFRAEPTIRPALGREEVERRRRLEQDF